MKQGAVVTHVLKPIKRRSLHIDVVCNKNSNAVKIIPSVYSSYSLYIKILLSDLTKCFHTETLLP